MKKKYIYILDGINSTLDTTKEKPSEFEDIAIETMKMKHREIRLKKKFNEVSENCWKTSSNLAQGSPSRGLVLVRGLLGTRPHSRTG